MRVGRRMRQPTQPPGTLTYYFEIEDTGVGIPADKQELIFSPFVQVSSENNKKTEGAGLGLTIAKRIVEALGGQIGVRSTLGSGSTFWIEIPLRQLPPGTIYPPLNTLPLHDSASLRSLARILSGNANTTEPPGPPPPPPRRPIIIATSFRGPALFVVSSYFGQWNISIDVLDSPESLAETQASLFLVDDDLDLLGQTLKTWHPDRRVAHFSSLTRLSPANKLVESFQTSPPVVIIPKPLGPRRIARAILYLLGYNECQLPPQLPPSSPLVNNAAVSARRLTEMGSSTTGQPRLHTVDVLVVEDNPINQMIMRKMLDSLQVRYQVTASGNECLELWKASPEPIPLIFMDVEIEGTINGLEATSEIRRLEQEVAPRTRSFIAIMTGRALKSDQQEGIANGCDLFLTKPVSVNAIRDLVQAHVAT